MEMNIDDVLKEDQVSSRLKLEDTFGIKRVISDSDAEEPKREPVEVSVSVEPSLMKMPEIIQRKPFRNVNVDAGTLKHPKRIQYSQIRQTIAGRRFSATKMNQDDKAAPSKLNPEMEEQDLSIAEADVKMALQRLRADMELPAEAVPKEVEKSLDLNSTLIKHRQSSPQLMTSDKARRKIGAAESSSAFGNQSANASVKNLNIDLNQNALELPDNSPTDRSESSKIVKNLSETASTDGDATVMHPMLLSPRVQQTLDRTEKSVRLSQLSRVSTERISPKELASVMSPRLGDNADRTTSIGHVPSIGRRGVNAQTNTTDRDGNSLTKMPVITKIPSIKPTRVNIPEYSSTTPSNSSSDEILSLSERVKSAHTTFKTVPLAPETSERPVQPSKDRDYSPYLAQDPLSAQVLPDKNAFSTDSISRKRGWTLWKKKKKHKKDKIADNVEYPEFPASAPPKASTLKSVSLRTNRPISIIPSSESVAKAKKAGWISWNSKSGKPIDYSSITIRQLLQQTQDQQEDFEDAIDVKNLELRRLVNKTEHLQTVVQSYESQASQQKQQIAILQEKIDILETDLLRLQQKNQEEETLTKSASIAGWKAVAEAAQHEILVLSVKNTEIQKRLDAVNEKTEAQFAEGQRESSSSQERDCEHLRTVNREMAHEIDYLRVKVVERERSERACFERHKLMAGEMERLRLQNLELQAEVRRSSIEKAKLVKLEKKSIGKLTRIQANETELQSEQRKAPIRNVIDRNPMIPIRSHGEAVPQRTYRYEQSKQLHATEVTGTATGFQLPQERHYFYAWINGGYRLMEHRTTGNMSTKDLMDHEELTKKDERDHSSHIPNTVRKSFRYD